MSWSAEQQRLLGAMGYDLLVRAAHPAGGQAEAFAALRRAVRRAAGEREPGGLIADYARLRREPALKRALWPRLRALRRSH